MKAWQRLSVRLNLIIVLVILFEWGFLFAPHSPFLQRPSPLAEVVTPDSERRFREMTRRILNDSTLTYAQKRERLEPLLEQRLEDNLILSEVSQLLVTVYEPRVDFTPLFWTALLLLPTVTLALLLHWWLVRPLERLAHATHQVIQGDLSTRVSPPNALAHRGDELFALTERFNEMAQTLQANELERQRVTADIAHELRTPLSVMQAQLDGMLEGVIPVSRAELLSLGEETDLLARLVEDLRLLSLAEAGRLTLHKQEVDLVALLKSVQQSVTVMAAEKRVGLGLSVSEETVPVSVDPKRIRQVIGNLLQNALRYTPSGGQIRLELTRCADTIYLSVADSGPGIPEADLPHLFRRFYRAEKSRIRAEGGSGLGLAIAKTLIELHGGRIEAGNQLGGGAVFTVMLSAAPHTDE